MLQFLFSQTSTKIKKTEEVLSDEIVGDQEIFKFEYHWEAKASVFILPESKIPLLENV